MEERKDIFTEKVIELNRVSRTVKGGKRIGFRALVIVGDKSGRAGIGIGKANDVSVSIQKATSQAKRNLKNIKINKDGTISKEVLSSFHSSKVLLRPAPEGTSIIAGGVVRAVAELAGIRNLVAKSLGSSNKINTARATLEGLLEAGYD
ncbi:MAG: 30S ribosomal protein S5 [Candidatus Berkelbacteria bacterium]|nr:30S ribosomal protein S5 [Candidatus Berkelbacteria bacterium]